jgi:hypothetical protein
MKPLSRLALVSGLYGCYGGGAALDSTGSSWADGSSRDAGVSSPDIMGVAEIASTNAPSESPDANFELTVDGNGDMGTLACSGPRLPLPEHLGFSAPLPSSAARIGKVLPNELQLDFASGANVEFSWLGPSLPFQAGEVVSVQRLCRSDLSHPCWDLVRGSSNTAATWLEQGSSEGKPHVPDDLPGAPHLVNLTLACEYEEQPVSCVGASPRRAGVYELRVEWQGTSTAILESATHALGPWNVSNVVAIAAPPQMGGLCIIEGGFSVGVTMLGPGSMSAP